MVSFMLKTLKLSAVLVLLSTQQIFCAADTDLLGVKAEDVLELKFQSMCKPLRTEPVEFNQAMKRLHDAAAVYSSKSLSSVDKGLDALEMLADSAENDIKTLLMPFAEFTRCLNRFRPSIPDEEVIPTDPVINNREKAFNIIVSALFDFDDQSVAESFRKAFGSGQTQQTLCISADGKILKLNEQIIDENILVEKTFYPLIRQATANFIKSVMHIWESTFMRDLRKNNRVTVIKVKPPQAPTVVAAKHEIQNAESDTEFDFVENPKASCTFCTRR